MSLSPGKFAEFKFTSMDGIRVACGRTTAAAVAFLSVILFVATAPRARAQTQSESGAPDIRIPAAADDGEQDATALAKTLQNPFGDLYNMPFQNNTNVPFGPYKKNQNVLDIQPIIPIHLDAEWNIITRTILPLVWQPTQLLPKSAQFGSAPATFSAFLSPREPIHGWLWGVGPIIQVPTTSNSAFGSNVWGLGPTGAVAYLQGPWVAGVLVNDVWSLGGTSGLQGAAYNRFLTEFLVDYNFGNGWYVGTEPIITADWPAIRNKAWTLPIGMELGRLIQIGKLPVNIEFGAFYNTIRPVFGSTWQLRTQITFVF